jgi:uncharacterized membrane protein
VRDAPGGQYQEDNRAMRYVKYALYALGAVIVLVIAAAVFVAATFDPKET